MDPTLEAYVRSRQIELAHSVRARSKIYLDVRFWIIARNVANGRKSEPAHQALVDALQRGVALGKIVCPISDSTFLELMKQSDISTRTATARVIDELSLGVSLSTIETRIATEIAHLFHASLGRHVYPIEDLVWTKLSYVLGFVHPEIPSLDSKIALSLQKEFFDVMWRTSLTDMIDTIGDAPQPSPDKFNQSAANIDAEIQAHKDSLKSFQQALRNELAGAVDLSGEAAATVIAEMARSAGVASSEPGSASWNTCVNMCKNLLFAAFEKPATKKTLRSMYIHACLHAGLRWDKNTRFEANHSYDFIHATSAIAYCDAFFTERFLSHLVNTRHLRLSEVSGCRVTADVEEAVAILRSLIQ